jgi:hypothetical protein
MTENPFLIIELSSCSMRPATSGGRISPYNSFARSVANVNILSSAPSILGLGDDASSGMGFISSIIPAIKRVLSITTFFALSPRYENSASISPVVR